MVTNYPQGVVVGGQTARAMGLTDEGLSTRLAKWLQQTWCALHRHDSLLEFERDRMFLRCTSCGYETPGWTVKAARPALRFQTQARTQALAVRSRLDDARRSA